MFASAVCFGVQAGSPPPKNTSWKVVAMGDMEAHDGTPFSFTSYKAPDGATVTVISGDFSSVEEATAELDFQKKEAQKVIKEEAICGKNGAVIGRRIVTLLEKTQAQAALAQVAWTEGVTFYLIASPSLEIALEWEKNHSHSPLRCEKQ